ncbi:MAG: M61 family metallopeptidase [Pseudomonadota bacterium]
MGAKHAVEQTSKTAKPAVRYSIAPKDLAGHLFTVTVTVTEPDSKGQVFMLPAWIPGSYMIREFARHIVQISAESNGDKVTLVKRDKHTWQADPCNEALTVTYEVYAWDLSVRAAHLDQTHGFFNGSSVFLCASGHEHAPHHVDIGNIDDPACSAWRVATALPELEAERYGFGTYAAADYDELIDHPVEIGNFVLASFEAHGVPHDVVISGRVPNLDMPRLCADLQNICESQIALFEPETKRAPMERYVFMTLAVGDGYGGLEHRASTALICARADLPVIGQTALTDGYRSYLGLCSHEYFHTWNVKRIKPAAFAPYQLAAESYTSLLWLFEGFTSYYDDLTLVRTGVIDEAAYCSLLANTINGVLRGSGRTKQSVAESSFDAWIKYYRQDENAPNAIVSYYNKGSLVALALDLTICARSEGRKSLDDVMRALWHRYGRDFYGNGAVGRGVAEAEVEALFDKVTGLSLKHLFEQWIRGTADLPLTALLQPFGVALADQRDTQKPVLGIRPAKEGLDCRLANVYEGGAAHRAGLSANDVLVAIDSLRVTSNNLDTLLGRYRIGDTVAVHAFRRDELLCFDVTLAADAAPKIVLTIRSEPEPDSISAVTLRDAWLHPGRSNQAH